LRRLLFRLLLATSPPSMDTISRENNSMLPVGAIIVGVIALLLGGYAAITLSKVNRTLAEQDAKFAKLEQIESTANAAASASEKAAKEYQGLRTSTQEAFNQVGAELSRMSGSLLKLEESAKKPASVASKDGKKGGEPAVAGPGEYVVKPGDSGMKIANANGVSIGDLQAVNPGVNWNGLKVGQKLKLPKK
jgi:LysM repeat protein